MNEAPPGFAGWTLAIEPWLNPARTTSAYRAGRPVMRDAYFACSVSM